MKWRALFAIATWAPGRSPSLPPRFQNATIIPAHNLWGVSGHFHTPQVRGVSGHAPRLDRRNALHSTPPSRRGSCSPCRIKAHSGAEGSRVRHIQKGVWRLTRLAHLARLALLFYLRFSLKPSETSHAKLSVHRRQSGRPQRTRDGRPGLHTTPQRSGQSNLLPRNAVLS